MSLSNHRKPAFVFAYIAIGVMYGVLVSAAESGNDQSSGGSSKLQVIYTRQTYFSIPFRVNEAALGNQTPAEVQMLVSTDNGAHWQLYSRVPPSQKQIPFRASTDGEYYFAVRTVDRAGKPHPENISGPDLWVVVDTMPPQMQLSAQCGPAGQITALWQISDLHLKTNSLSLQYRVSTTEEWQSVALAEKNSTVTDTLQSGEVSWWPQPGTEDVQIRAEIVDTAGNKSISHAQVKVNRGADTQAGMANSRKDGNGLMLQPATGSNGKLSDRTNADSRSGMMSQGINPPIGNRYTTSNKMPVDPELSMLPNGERPRMLNAHTFELDYDLESVGPSGIGRVEVWGTRDGGRNWRLFAVDDDNRSPVTVSVEEEGVYGFQIAATNGAGLGQGSPKSGDVPSIWVGVDLTKPIARIISAEMGKGDEDGQLLICWEAADKMLAEGPISLSYSQNPAGPWTAIAAGLENTGRFSWAIDSRVPPVVYLRLEVRDEAGNLSVQDSSQPVALDQSRPTVKIRDVRPLSR